jgi:hypothetical protein
MRRDKVMETLNEMPIEFALEQLIERLILIEKIEQAQEQIKNGDTKTHEQVKELVQTWRK